MMIDFSLDAVVSTEFGMGVGRGREMEFSVVPIDEEVQEALRAMARGTLDSMSKNDEEGREYNPANKNNGTEYSRIQAGNQFEMVSRTLYDAENLPENDDHVTNLVRASCYFARFVDEQDRCLTAIRRANHFKGVLEKKLIVFSDTFTIIEDKVFKLDTNFDLLIDSRYTHILKPANFVFLEGLENVIMNLVSDNIRAIEQNLHFVDLSVIEEYAGSRIRAANYLASIRSHGLEGVDQERVEDLCRVAGVEFSHSNGKIVVEGNSQMKFLQVLDQRVYKSEICPDNPEVFSASNRVKIG